MFNKHRLMIRLINFWPPFIGTGIRVKKIAHDYTSVDVEMRLRWWNRNIMGVHFGGSLYALCDPFFMLILMQHLGRDYIVWDKGATIRFLKPGASHVNARFEISHTRIDEVRMQADRDYKVEPTFTAQVLDDAGNVIAEVEKLLYVRRKDKVKTVAA